MKIYINENEYVTAGELKKVTREQLENNIAGKRLAVTTFQM